MYQWNSLFATTNYFLRNFFMILNLILYDLILNAIYRKAYIFGLIKTHRFYTNIQGFPQFATMILIFLSKKMRWKF